MIKQIIKRDGRTVLFNAEKIANAIFKAARASGGNDYDLAMELAIKVVNKYEETHKENEIPTVEQIQDLVETTLIKNGHDQTAKQYILYRHERTKNRTMKTELMKTLDEITNSDAKDSDIKRENGNINGDTSMGTMLKYGSSSSKEYYHQYILDPIHSKAHKDGDIHIHDLDFYTLTTTCTQIDCKKLLTNGFSTGHGFLREPNDISSYSALACIAIQSNQNDQHGGQSIPKFDYDMADGVKKTFKTRYEQNLIKACEIYNSMTLLADVIDEDNVLQTEIEYRMKSIDMEPSLSNIDDYNDEMFSKLKEVFSSDKMINKILKFAKKHAIKETNRATYQAMEALVHNLNTMHSRAGAQVGN